MSSLWQPHSPHTQLHQARYPDPDTFPDRQQPARPQADLLSAIAALLAERQPRNAPSLHTEWTLQQSVTERSIASWGQSTTSLGHTRRHLGPKSSSSASPCGVSSNLSCLNDRSFQWFLPTCLLGAQDIAGLYVSEQPFTMDSRPSHVGGSAWFGSVSKWLECA